MLTWFDHTPDGIRLHVRVIPNAAKNELVGILNGRLKIKLHSPPIDGRANKALIDFLATSFHIPKSSLHVMHGIRGREKTVLIQGVSERQLKEHLHHLSASL